MAGLHDIRPIAESDPVRSAVFRPMRAAACAASMPAWPPPMTRTSNRTRGLSLRQREDASLLPDTESREQPRQHVFGRRLADEIGERVEGRVTVRRGVLGRE